ncbi:hypothetical protein NL108_000938, partial [Boleophthalmus pectinirostris]
GLKKTIACMDEEHPRTEASINNRSHLRQILHIEALYKRSKIENSPFKTLLEMIVKHMIEGSNEENTCSVSSFFPRSHIEITKPSQTTLLGPDKPERVPQNQSSLSAHDQRGQALMASHDTELFKSAGTESAKRNKTSRIRRGMMPGPIASIPEESVKKRQIRKTEIPQPLPTNEGKSGCGNSLLVSHFDQKTIKSTFFQNSCHDCFQGSYAPEGEQPILQMEKRFGKLLYTDYGITFYLDRIFVIHSIFQSSVTCQVELKCIRTDDIDDEEMQSLSKMSLNRDITEQSWTSCPMDQRTAMELKDVLIGSSFNCFNVEWRNQGFTFSETDDLRYGIVQKKGGPCGVLASVQGFVLKKMLFGTSDPSNTLNKLRPSNSTRRKCLVLAIAEILWKAGEGKQATVAINSGTKHFIPVGQYKSEGVFERMILFTLDKRKDLEHFVDQHIEQACDLLFFESEVMGCLLFVVSAVLSRSVDKVREDMDVPTTTLIGAHGYCTQELVNLLLWGQAVSNVFDNDMELDSGNGNITLLKGIKDHCEIGFLSLFEHYNICKVGSYLKTPHFPIWVVCSESHFSVLFGLQRELLISHQKGQEFDLYYYDGLSNQQEEIRLSVCKYRSVGGSTLSCMDDATELIPPLELCIRT